MNVRELSRDQLVELKQAYLCETNNSVNYGTSYEELADADSLISDNEIITQYDGYDFSDDDFFCTAGRD